MNETSSQPQSPPPTEKGLTPEVHSTEQITDPKRLSEIVLNTLDVTFDYKLLHLDERFISRLLEDDPSKHWSSIFNLLSRTIENAGRLQPQIRTIDQALSLVENFNVPLPVSTAGEPPRTIVDRRGVEELLKRRNVESEAKRSKDEAEQKDWSLGKRGEYQAEQEKSHQEDIYKDPVRRLARLIRKFQQDGVVHGLTKAMGFGELLTLRGKTHYKPDLKPLIGMVIEGMRDAEECAVYGKNVLRQYTEGRLPDENIVRDVIGGGTKAIPLYLEAFGASQNRLK